MFTSKHQSNNAKNLEFKYFFLGKICQREKACPFSNKIIHIYMYYQNRAL